MIFHDVEQGSMEWHRLRMGVPTSSSFDRIITPKKGDLSSQADSYIAELIAERLLGILPENAEHFTSRAMEHGIATEDEARRYYCLQRDVDVTNGGFCLTDDGRIGASPDFRVKDRDRGGEIKCPQPATHVRYLLAGTIPPDYLPQVHGQLVVTGWEAIDFLSYCPGLPPLLIEVTPNDYTAKVREALEAFLGRYAEQLARLTREAA